MSAAVSSQPLITLTPRGLYCTVGDFYIDPCQPVPRAVITHAHGDHAQIGSARYLSAAPGLGVLKYRLGPDANVEGVPYGEPRILGGARVSLHPAGHILGSSQIRVEVDGEVWVISGDYKRGEDPTCAPFEVVPCHTFITEATFAAPIYRWEGGPAIARQILSWWRDRAVAGQTALLFCYALGKAQRLLAELARLPDVPTEPVLLHGAMVALTHLYRDAGVTMLPTERFQDEARAPLAGRLVLAPPSAYRSPWMRRFKSFETGFASGWMRVRGAQRQRGHDRGFALSDHADWGELVRTVHETGAKHVLATHGRADLLVRHLKEQGVDAQILATGHGSEGED
jgi:putative mRNA 3-end processing factor